MNSDHSTMSTMTCRLSRDRHVQSETERQARCEGGNSCMPNASLLPRFAAPWSRGPHIRYIRHGWYSHIGIIEFPPGSSVPPVCHRLIKPYEIHTFVCVAWDRSYESRYECRLPSPLFYPWRGVIATSCFFDFSFNCKR